MIQAVKVKTVGDSEPLTEWMQLQKFNLTCMFKKLRKKTKEKAIHMHMNMHVN